MTRPTLPQPAALLSWLRQRQPAQVALLADLVRAESPSSDPDSQQPVLDRLEAELHGLGFHCERHPGTSSGGLLYAGPGATPTDAPFQLLVGHCDTVWPRGSLQQMPLTTRGSELHGPGVYDMKAGLTQAIHALAALQAFDVKPELAPVVVVTSDEEIGSPDSRRILRALAAEAERAFVLEPSLGRQGRLKTARKGVGRFHVSVRGRAAHAGLDPGAGISAILELSHVIQQLFALNDPDRGVTVNVGTIDGGLRPNVVAPDSHAVVDVRVPSLADAAQVEAAIRSLSPHDDGATIEVSGGFSRPPMERTPGNRALWKLARELGSTLGLELEEGTAGGGSDGNITSQLTPTLDGLGAVGDGAHAAHEFVDLDHLAERTALLALLVAAPPLPEPTSGQASGRPS